MEENIKKESDIKIKILYTALAISVLLVLYFGVSLFLELNTQRTGREFFATMPVEFVPRDILNAPVGSVHIFHETREEHAEEPQFVPFVDFDALRVDFPSIVGWIQSEGTVINYPIVQGVDNDFYLYRLPDGTRHAWGSIFMDYRHAADFSGDIIKIYGHNMRSGDKFGSLKYYESQLYFHNHPTMFIFTPYQNFVLEIFAGYFLDSGFEVPPLTFRDAEHFYEYIIDIRSRSIFTSLLDINFGDQIVLLCTCTESSNRNERLIIAGRLVEF
jgi:sortase B